MNWSNFRFTKTEEAEPIQTTMEERHAALPMEDDTNPFFKQFREGRKNEGANYYKDVLRRDW